MLDLSERRPDAALGDIRYEERYSRQLRFGPIGRNGQEMLRRASVLIVGIGALGASLAQHMARAGVGTVRIADRDYVEPSNLQRQSLFDEQDALQALPKAVAAAKRLQAINSGVQIEAHVTDVTERTVEPLAAGVDLVLDGTDNAGTRLLLNEVCYRNGIPLIYGGVAGSSGMSAVFVPGVTGCLQCVIGGNRDSAADEGMTCDTVGVISPAVDFTASLQAAEALKWLSGNKKAVRRSLLSYDLWTFGFREMQLPGPSSSCPVCGCHADREYGSVPDVHRQLAAAALCGRDTVQVTMPHPLPIREWERVLEERGCRVMANPYLVRAELPGGHLRLVLFPDGRVLVQGTSDPDDAMIVCEKYLHF
ncbi:ThiF family adenylyltransferase [Paenibacillus tarimensis]